MTTRWDVERAVLRSNLPPPARHIMLTLCTLATANTAVIPAEHSPSLSTLHQMTGLAKSTIAERLNLLEAEGWTRRDRPTVERARADKERTRYQLRIPSSPAPGLASLIDPSMASPAGGLDRPTRTGIASPGAGQASPPAGHELVREPDRASPPAGHKTDQEQPTKPLAPVEPLDSNTPEGIVRSHTNATASEAAAVANRVRNERQPRSLPGLLRRMGADGDLVTLLGEHRAAVRRGEIDEWLSWVRQQPPCPHAQPGGDLPHPTTHEPTCALCRRAAKLRVLRTA